MDPPYNYYYDADVVLTQGGSSRTVSAVATVLGWWSNASG
jgi:hypothetical protein